MCLCACVYMCMCPSACAHALRMCVRVCTHTCARVRVRVPVAPAAQSAVALRPHECIFPSPRDRACHPLRYSNCHVCFHFWCPVTSKRAVEEKLTDTWSLSAGGKLLRHNVASVFLVTNGASSVTMFPAGCTKKDIFSTVNLVISLALTHSSRCF